MTSAQIRQQFLDFFKSKQHQIVPSAPIVVKNDPTLLFTNAGMNQFKDYFLGNKKPDHSRIADTQKCLRVSGKHNDLEEVGVDTYHHTMFEMLGNWSFGDYFKAEAIAWSWELLVDVYKLDKDKLYVTIFEGDTKEGLPKDEEAYTEWKKWISEDRILLGKKKDNFWEMGDSGPCGPCTEIHVDCRPDAERKSVDGKTLVNTDHPQVIEIWNNVFIQFNRLKDGSLEPLPAKHVDTGMGFERLVRVIQNKTSNYDTDVFTITIKEVERITGRNYEKGDSKKDIAFRVLADHIRAIAFTIADGQIPSNTGAGYVIRRILRRAVRYYYSFLDHKEPLLYKLIPLLALEFKGVFPELQQQIDFVSIVILDEERAFLRTLGQGLNKVNEYFTKWKKLRIYIASLSSSQNLNEDEIKEYISLSKFITDHEIFKLSGLNKIQDYYQNIVQQNIDTHLFNSYNNSTFLKKEFLDEISLIQSKSFVMDGKFAFQLSDTDGFPLDLTSLIAKELGWTVDEAGFEAEMQEQKNRSRAATAIDTEDWVALQENASTEFVGYKNLETKTTIVKYRKVKAKGKESYQIVLASTPFYAESGGQVGDTGKLIINKEELVITDTKKENNLIIHFAESLPANITDEVIAKVDVEKRKSTAANHSATHLLHAALRNVLGTHVAQKGSLVNNDQLRFDFSHFAKVTDTEIAAIEKIVNEKIRENIPVVIKEMNKDEAVQLGAMALFGEKYGNVVRVVIIDPNYSIELCGGTHVGHTGELGFFKIKHESAVAAGVRRIEAVSGQAAESFINEQFVLVNAIREALKNPKEINKAIDSLVTENNELKKKLESIEAKQLTALTDHLLGERISFPLADKKADFIGKVVDVSNADHLKKLCFDLKTKLQDNYVVALAANINGKAGVAIMLSDSVVNGKGLEAPKIIKEHITPLIKGGGGGQKTLATAGGQDASSLPQVIEKVKALL